MSANESGEFGFAYRTCKNGEVQILRHGRLVTTLRGALAVGFLTEVSDSEDLDAQHLMARLTGNYKRGNERLARNHPRNRR